MSEGRLAADLGHDRKVAIRALEPRHPDLPPAYIPNMSDISPSSRALPAAVLARIESRVGEERMEWYAMSPEARWAASSSLWASFVALGGSVDSDPDPARVGSLAEYWASIRQELESMRQELRRRGTQ